MSAPTVEDVDRALSASRNDVGVVLLLCGVSLGAMAAGALADWSDDVWVAVALGICVVACLVVVAKAVRARGLIGALVADTWPDADRWEYVELPWPQLRELVVAEVARRQLSEGLDRVLDYREIKGR